MLLIRKKQMLELRTILRRMSEQLAHVAVYRCCDTLSNVDLARRMGCSSRHLSNLLDRHEHWIRQPEIAACNS